MRTTKHLFQLLLVPLSVTSCALLSCAPLRAVVTGANRAQCAMSPSPPAQRSTNSETGALRGLESACSAGSIVYIVPVDGGVVLVDAGLDESGAPIQAALHGRRVLAVLLTHGHLDHRAAAHRFKAPVYVGRADLDLIKGKRGSKAPLAVLGDLLGVPPLPRVVLPVDDGFTLVVGRKVFTAVSLPGHTPGSTGWLVEHAMFTGDAVQSPLGDAIYPGPPSVTDDMRMAYESFRKLRLLDVHTIYDGHFGRRDDLQKRIGPALERAHDDVAILEQPAVRPAGCSEGDVVP